VRFLERCPDIIVFVDSDWACGKDAGVIFAVDACASAEKKLLRYGERRTKARFKFSLRTYG
jgi:hypothetical protein